MKIARVNSPRLPTMSSPSGLGGVLALPALDDLTDVDTSGAVPGDTIIFDGSDWLPGAGGGGSSLPWFDVMDYGAVHDGTTDDTPAIQDAIDACMAAGGGTVFFPPGIYQLDGALVSTSTYNSQLTIPQNAYSGSTPSVAIRLLGMGPNVPASDAATGTAVPSEGGAILRSSWNGTISGNPAILAAGLHDAMFGDASYNWVFLTLQDIQFRAHSNPKLTAVDMTAATGCRIKDVTFSTDVASGSATLPTNANAIALDMARGLNSQQPESLDGLMIEGYYIGVRPSEQANGDISVGRCTQGIVFRGQQGTPSFTRHGGFFSKITIYQCPRGIVFSGDQRWINIGMVSIEHDPSPFAAVYDIDDASNYGRGFIGWHTTDYSTGPADDLLVNGAEGLSLFGAYAQRWKLTDVVHVPQIGTNPGTDPATGRFIYSDDTTEHLTVRKPDGSDVDLETGGGTPATTVTDETTFGITPAVGTDTEYARQDHTHGSPDAPTGIGPILISDTPSTPLIFADLIQNEAQDDLVYADT